MSNNQNSELFKYITKEPDVQIDKLSHIFTQIYTHVPPKENNHKKMTMEQFQNLSGKSANQKNLQENLFQLFYLLDRDKKGYLNPEDILKMFDTLDRKITIEEIQISYKYAKVLKNKMTFDDFKQYYYNF